MANPDQLQAWLAEAEQARHELLIGSRAVSVSSGSGKSISFTQSDLGRLDLYIADLKRQLGQDPGSRPFVPTF